jgi:hypothetical protein
MFLGLLIRPTALRTLVCESNTGAHRNSPVHASKITPASQRAPFTGLDVQWRGTALTAKFRITNGVRGITR